MFDFLDVLYESYSRFPFLGIIPSLKTGVKMQKEDKTHGSAGLHPDVPVERQRMLLRPWLQVHLELSDIPGLEWVDEDKTLFRIPWKHKSKGNWTSAHGAVFVEWAKNTGRFHEEYDTAPNYAHLKTRLRCAINKAQDIEEVDSLSNMKAFEPYRVYRFLPRPDRRFSDYGTLAIPRKRSTGGEVKPEKGGWTITHEREEVPAKRKRLVHAETTEGRLTHPNIVQRLVQRLVTEDGTQVDVVREEEVEAVYMDDDPESPENEAGSSGEEEEEECDEGSVPIPETVVELEAEEVEVITQPHTEQRNNVYVVQPEADDQARSQAGGIAALVEAAQLAAADLATSQVTSKSQTTYTHIKERVGPVVDLSTTRKQVVNGGRHDHETTNLIASPSVTSKANPLIVSSRAEVMDLSKKSSGERQKAVAISDAVNLTLRKTEAVSDAEAMNLSVKEEDTDEGGSVSMQPREVTLRWNAIVAQTREVEAKAKSLSAKEQALEEWEARLLAWERVLKHQQEVADNGHTTTPTTVAATSQASVDSSEVEARVSFYEDNEGDQLRVPVQQSQGSMIRQILLSGRSQKTSEAQTGVTETVVGVKRNEASLTVPHKRQVIIPIPGVRESRPIVQRQGKKVVVVSGMDATSKYVIANEREGLAMLSDVASGNEETFVLFNEEGKEIGVGERVLPAISKHQVVISQAESVAPTVVYVPQTVMAAASASSTNLSLSALSPAITDMLNKPSRPAITTKPSNISAAAISIAAEKPSSAKVGVSDATLTTYKVTTANPIGGAGMGDVGNIVKLTRASVASSSTGAQPFVVTSSAKALTEHPTTASPKVVWKERAPDSEREGQAKLVWTDRSSIMAAKEAARDKIVVKSSIDLETVIKSEPSTVVSDGVQVMVVNTSEDTACLNQVVSSPHCSNLDSSDMARDTQIRVVVQRNPANNTQLNIDCKAEEDQSGKPHSPQP